MNNDLRVYWTPIVNIFDPLMPLVGPLLEPCYVEPEDSPLPTLFLKLQPGRVTPKILVTGQRGCGKTSALVQLAHRLSEDYFVVWIDLHASLDVYRFSILDLFLALGGGIYKVAHDTGLNPDPAHWQEIVNALSTLVGQVLKQPDYTISAETFLAEMVAARGDPAMPFRFGEVSIPTRRFSLELKKEVVDTLRVGPVLRELVTRVNRIIADVTAQAGREVLVIADGMDKVNIAMAKDIFSYHAALAELTCRTVYTFPYALYKSAESGIQEYYFEPSDFPNIRLYSRKGVLHEPGSSVLRRVIELRLEAIGLSLDDVLTAEALDALIAHSGGVMRVLIRLMRGACFRAEERDQRRITFEDVAFAIGREQRARDMALSDDAKAYLRRFKGRWQDDEFFLTQIQEGNIVAYAEEGRFWYAVHPMVNSLLKSEESIENV